jgi:ribosomal protein L31
MLKRRMKALTVSSALIAILLVLMSPIGAISATGWTEPVLVADGSRTMDSWSPDIVVDGDGDILVVYAEGTSINFTEYTSGIWSEPENLCPSIHYGTGPPSIDVDPSNNAHVAFPGYSGSGWVTYYTTNSTGSWSDPVIISGDDEDCSSPSLGVDSLGICHAAYNVGDDPMYLTRYVSNSGGSWSDPVTISGEHETINQPALGLDSSNNAHVVYVDLSLSFIGYVHNTSGSWSDPVIISGDDLSVNSPDLEVDTSDSCHVAYESNGVIRYVNNTSGSWPESTAVSEPSTSWGKRAVNCSLTLDAVDNPQIAYQWFYGPRHLVRFTSEASGSWSEPVTVYDTKVRGCYWPSIASDGEHSHIVFGERNSSAISNCYICYVTNSEGSWSDHTTISAVNPDCTDPSLKCDSAGNEHLVYFQNSSEESKLNYTENTSGSWSAPTVINTGDSGWHTPELELDTSDKAHAVYHGNNSVSYNSNLGGSWEAPVVISSDDIVCGSPSMTLDDAAKAHVIYTRYDGIADSYDIRYATNAGGSWSAPATVSSGDAVGSYSDPSLGMGTDNILHIIYPRASEGDIRYTTNAGGSWSLPATISGEDSSCRNCRVVVDDSNHIHVAYHVSDSLRYVSNEPGTWSDPLTISGDDEPFFWNFESVTLETVSSESLHAAYVFYDDGYFRVRYVVREEGDWSEPVTISEDFYSGMNPSIAVEVTSGYPSCAFQSDDGCIKFTQYCGTTPTINSIDPNSGPQGWTGNVTISGLNTSFDETSTLTFSGDGINFNSIVGTPTATEITANITIGNGASPTARDVNVITGDETPEPLSGGFIVTEAPALVPVITSISPTSGETGTTVTINGSNFGNTRGASTVKFGSKTCASADYVSWSNTQVKVKAPGGISGKVNLTVTTAGGTSNSRAFTVTRPPDPEPEEPSVTSVHPTSGPPGTLVTIKGKNFGNSRGSSERTAASSSYVTFGGVKATSYPRWSDTEIRAVVPDGAPADGAVEVVTPAGASPEKKEFIVCSPTWYLAEGTSDWGFETYVTIMNPNTEAVTASVTYMTPEGKAPRPDVTLPPGSQTTVNPRGDIGSKDFSTVVECTTEGRTIAVDRRMMWTGEGAASPDGHASVGVTSPAKTWYLPEGSSSWGFECWLLIQNPNDRDATCQVTYMVENLGARTVTKTVPASSRETFNMADDLPDVEIKDASIKVDSDVPVIPERAMYRNDRRSGHASIGTTTPAKEYFLAEGTTDWGFTTYVLVQNPNDTDAAVEVTYLTGDGPVQHPEFPMMMPANSRKTIRVNDFLPGEDFSTRVSADRAIIAERAMYWGEGTPSGEACHDSIGMPMAHTTFYLPDGETQNGHETWTLVANPNDTEVKIQVTYMTPGGNGNQDFTDTVPANARRTYNMADHIPSGKASIMVTCTTPGKKIMVERAMYWNDRGAGTDTIGGYAD